MARTTHNPFLMSEAKIEDEVYFTDRCSSHETYDSSSLLNVPENIISQANHVVDNHVLIKNPTPVEHLDVNFQANNFDPKFSTLKHLACQMHSKPLSEESAHKTTIGILENLATFSWASKAVLSLAAFANEYGGFWHLVQSPMTDTLAKSLGILNRVPAIVSPLALTRHKRAITELSEMVKSTLDMVKCITEMESLFATYNKYDEEDMPLLYQGMKHIPIDTYWTVLSIVACSCQMADPEYKYQLTRYDQKLQSILTQIKDRLDHMGTPPSPLPLNPTDIVEFLKALIFHPMHIEHPNVFDGSTTQMVSIEVLSKKNVFLFISGLDRIEDDIMRLTPIHEAITKDEDKKDYKIIWLPMVDQWNDKEKAKFESLKKKMPWYVVEYFSPVKHRKHIMEKWQYMNKPSVVVLDSKENMVNTNAMPMIFSWGIEAFPFHDDAHICEHWNWLWFKVSKYFPHIQKWIDDTKYIFLYGGHDNLWVDKFTKHLKVITEDPKIKRADCDIEMFYLGKDNTNIV